MARGFKVGGVSPTSGGDATANDILLNKTAYVEGKEVIGNIPSQSAKTVTPTTTSQTLVTSGNYCSGDIIVDSIPNQQDGGTWTPSTSAQTMVAANKYLKTAVTVNAIPNQQNGGTWTPSTSAQTMVAANKYLKTAAIVAAIPNQTTGGAKYATTSAQTVISSGKYVTTAVTLGALSQSNLAAANIVSGKTITISNGSTNVWSVTGTATGYKCVSGSVTGTTDSNRKNFLIDDWTADCCYGTVNPGITPAYSFSYFVDNSNKNHFCWCWRRGKNQWNVFHSGGWWGGWRQYHYNGTEYNQDFRFASNAVDLPAIDMQSAKIYYWIFG